MALNDFKWQILFLILGKFTQIDKYFLKTDDALDAFQNHDGV